MQLLKKLEPKNYPYFVLLVLIVTVKLDKFYAQVCYFSAAIPVLILELQMRSKIQIVRPKKTIRTKVGSTKKVYNLIIQNKTTNVGRIALERQRWLEKHLTPPGEEVT